MEQHLTKTAETKNSPSRGGSFFYQIGSHGIFLFFILLLLVSATTIRLSAIDKTTLTMDSLDTLVSARYLVEGSYVVLNNEGAFAQMAYAPVAEWLYAIPFFCSENPFSSVYYTVFMNLIGLILLVVLVWRNFSLRVAPLALLFLVLNRSVIYYSRQPINTHLLTPFVILLFLLLFELVRRAEGRETANTLKNNLPESAFFPLTFLKSTPSIFCLLGLLFSIASQLNASSWGYIFSIILLPMLYATYRTLKNFILFIMGAMLPLFPLFINEFRRGFVTLRSFFSTLVQPSMEGSIGDISWYMVPQQLVTQLNDQLWLPAFLLLIGLVLMGFWCVNHSDKGRYILLFSWLVIPLTYLIFVSWHLGGRFYPHYLVSVLPSTAIIAALGLLFCLEKMGEYIGRSDQLTLFVLLLFLFPLLLSLSNQPEILWWRTGSALLALLIALLMIKIQKKLLTFSTNSHGAEIFIVWFLFLLLLVPVYTQQYQEVSEFQEALVPGLDTWAGLKEFADFSREILTNTEPSELITLSTLSNDQVFLSPGGMSFLLEARVKPYGNDHLPLLRKKWQQKIEAATPNHLPEYLMGVLPEGEFRNISGLHIFEGAKSEMITNNTYFFLKVTSENSHQISRCLAPCKNKNGWSYCPATVLLLSQTKN